MQLDFDDTRFEQTARVVLRYNESARDRGYTVDGLVAYMKQMATQNPNSICGTMGFYVASCPSHKEGALYVSAFPAPWLIPV